MNFRTHNRTRSSWRIVTPALALALAAGGLFGPVAGAADDKSSAPIDVANALSTAFRSAAARIDPSVVSIMVTKAAQTSPVALGNDRMPEEFRRFFDQMSPGRTPGPNGGRAPSAPKAHGEGSGVIVSEDGRILTNNHVIEGADSIRVKLSDGTEHTAAVVGADPEPDLAVLKIDASGLTAARIGVSPSLLPGDWVVAVGSPFGLDHTVTAGVVSATGRADVGLNTFEDFIQTDAAVNPGNSGGPLINLKGEVVGINSAIRTGGGMGSNGVGFAIPSSTFKRVMDSLIADGRVHRGWLGVSTQPLTQDLAASLSAESPKGALVSEVVDAAPAAKAGLQPGDIITEVNGRAVASPRELVNAIGGLSPGDQANLKIVRAGSTESLAVHLGTRPSKAELATGVGSANPELSFGMSLQPLTKELAEQFGVKSDSGVVISDIEPGSAAEEAGLEPGDVILEAAGKKVDSPAAVAAASRDAAKGKGLLLKVKNQAGTRFVVVKAPH